MYGGRWDRKELIREKEGKADLEINIEGKNYIGGPGLTASLLSGILSYTLVSYLKLLFQMISSDGVDIN